MAKRIPTPEQQSIISTLDSPLFVAAGAGSGKSATLAERVAWALTPGSGADGAPYIDSLDQALVITYTHAAADEIREKIRARLRQDERLAPHALEVDAAWISTIHGMCIRILKAHAFELGLDPELPLIADTLADQMLEEEVDACVRAVVSKPEYELLRKTFNVRSRSSAADDSGNTVIGMVKAICKAAASGVDGFGSLAFPGTVIPLAARLDAHLGACRAMEQLLDEVGFNSNASNDAGHAALLAQIDALSAFAAGRDQGDEAAIRCIEGLPALNGRAFGGKNLKDSWKELRQSFDSLLVSKELAACRPLAAQLVELARIVEESYRRRKRAEGLVDNGDLLRLTHDAFERHPEISRMYSGRFKLVMVDEFQDTNEQQVQMISRLSGEGAEHLTTVGDAQQSIYRFQGADVSVFNNRGEYVEQASHRILTTNFRSHADILAFVERVCSHGIISPFMPLRPSDVRRDAYRTPDLPRIALEITSGGSGTTVADRRAVAAQQLATRVKAYLDAGGSAGDVVLLMGSLSNVQVYLDALRALGIECVVSGGSSFTGTPEVGLVASLLDLLANPYATSSGLYPVLTSEIFFCDANDICLLATRDHEPLDELDLRRYDKRQLAEGFLALARDGADALCAGARPSDRLLAAADVLGRAFERLRTWQLADVLEGIVRESGWIARLEAEGPQGIAEAANVLAAIRFASQIADQDCLGISRASKEFSHWLTIARQGLASLDTGAAGVVRVMTVHASKGLEFPVCAVAELWSSPRGGDAIVSENIGTKVCAALVPSTASKNLAEVEDEPAPDAPIEDWAGYLSYLHGHSEQAERGRLLYVALTRAQEALIVCLTVSVTKTLNDRGTHWSPQLASDACSALFADDLPPVGLSQLEFGGSAPAIVRHVAVEKDKDGGEVLAQAAGAFEPVELPAEQPGAVTLFDPAIADGIAEARRSARPWKRRTGVFSYSSVHALLPHEEQHDAGASEQQEAYRRPLIVSEEEDEPAAAPFTGDADKATNLGSAFHQLAQTMVECGHAPSKERIAAACRTWGLSRTQRSRLAAAIDRWSRSALRAETLGYAVRRAEVPFFIAVDSEYGTHLEGAIDLLCTNPGSTHALMVDYKTGDAGLTYDQIRARHAMQANFYASVLARLGYETVECAFVCVELVDGSEEPVVARYRFESSNIHSLF